MRKTATVGGNTTNRPPGKEEKQTKYERQSVNDSYHKDIWKGCALLTSSRRPVGLRIKAGRAGKEKR